MLHDPLSIYEWFIETGTFKFRDVINDVIEIRTPSGTLIKVRIIFIDGSFLDIYWNSSGRYSLHYERRHIDGRIYRHDNAPHDKHRHLVTFPKHFHDGDEGKVRESHLLQDIGGGLCSQVVERWQYSLP